ncbi:MAG: lysozyme [Crocinitomix sp.]|jgi:lysozyme
MKPNMKIYSIALALIAFSCGGRTDKPDTDATDSTNVSASDTIVTETPTETVPQYVYGIDISSNQGDEVETLDKNKDSLTFVICRATDGITYTDPDFNSNWTTIQEKGFVRGAYHFFESEDDPADQVGNYMNAVGEIDAAGLPPIVDFEGAGIRTDMTVEAVQNNLLQVLEILAEKTGRTPILYTNINEGNKYLNTEDFAKYTLWIADYSGGNTPTLPGVWKDTKWQLWQKSDDYMENGVKNDFDIFNGDLGAFNAFLKTN